MPDLPLWALLWLAVLVALGALFAMTYRRMSKLTTRTRDLEDLQEAVGVDRPPPRGRRRSRCSAASTRRDAMPATRPASGSS